jgi:hypothetical protein
MSLFFFVFTVILLSASSSFASSSSLENFVVEYEKFFVDPTQLTGLDPSFKCEFNTVYKWGGIHKMFFCLRPTAKLSAEGLESTI